MSSRNEMTVRNDGVEVNNNNNNNSNRRSIGDRSSSGRRASNMISSELKSLSRCELDAVCVASTFLRSGVFAVFAGATMFPKQLVKSLHEIIPPNADIVRTWLDCRNRGIAYKASTLEQTLTL